MEKEPNTFAAPPSAFLYNQPANPNEPRTAVIGKILQMNPDRSFIKVEDISDPVTSVKQLGPKPCHVECP